MTLHAKISPETSTSPRFIREAPLFLVWLVDQHKLKSVAGGQGREALAFDYLETFLLGAVDTSRAAQNATVAAESLGLGAPVRSRWPIGTSCATCSRALAFPCADTRRRQLPSRLQGDGCGIDIGGVNGRAPDSPVRLLAPRQWIYPSPTTPWIG